MVDLALRSIRRGVVDEASLAAERGECLAELRGAWHAQSARLIAPCIDYAQLNKTGASRTPHRARDVRTPAQISKLSLRLPQFTGCHSLDQNHAHAARALQSNSRATGCTAPAPKTNLALNANWSVRGDADGECRI